MAEAEEIKSRKAPSVWGSWGSLSREELAKFKMVAIGSQEPNGCPGPANEASDNKLILPDEDVVRIGEVFRHLPKDQVERLLVETISLDTVPSLLELAMKHNCSELKLGCLKFLVDDGNWVSVSFKFRHEFSVVLHNHPSLVDYIKEMAQNLSGNLV